MSELAAMLAGGEKASRRWPLTVVARETGEDHMLGEGVPQVHLACRVCGQSVICLIKDLRLRGGAGLTGDMLLAGITAHVVRSHPDQQSST